MQEIWSPITGHRSLITGRHGKPSASFPRGGERWGAAPALAATRTQILYWTYLGAALSRRRLTRARLDRIVAELKAIGLGGPRFELRLSKKR
jgi:hypothetical protein